MSIEPPHSGLQGMDDASRSGEASHVELAGGGNETVTFCFSVQVAGSLIKEPDLRVNSLTGVGSHIEASAISLFRMHPIQVERWPGWHVRSIPPQQRDPGPFDVLVPVRAPRGGLPAALSPDQTYQFWVDLSIPKGTFAGVYNGAIDLTSGDRIVASTAIQLTVLPFVLPDRTDIAFLAEVDHRQLFRHHVTYQGMPYAPAVDDWRPDPLSERLNGLLASTMRMLRSHRLNAVPHRLTPIVKVAANGELALSWEQYDEVVGLCATGRSGFDLGQLRHWPLPVAHVFSTTRRAESLNGGSYDESVGRYVAACAEHFTRARSLSSVYALSPNSLPPGGASVSDAMRFGEAIRRAAPDVSVVTRGFPQNLRPYGWIDYPSEDLSKVTDIWLPPGQFYDPLSMAAQRDRERRAWVAVDRPPFTGSIAPSAPASSARALAWQCKRLDAEALYLGCINEWPDANDNPAPEDCALLDPNVLIYPGGPFGLDEPVPSVRLKRLRRSLEDVAYAQILDTHGLGHVGSTLCDSLVPYAGADAYRTHFGDGKRIGWPRDTGLFDDARKIMAEELTGSTPQTAPRGNTESLARSVAWRRFMTETRHLRLVVDGTRVRFMGAADAPHAEVEVAVTVTNGTRLPVQGRIGFGPLPEGWTWDPGRATSHSLPPGTDKHLTVTGRTTVVPTEAGGYMMLPIEFTTGDDKVHRVDARVSFITANLVTALPAIDGSLADWPAGSTNVAADFRLITHEMSNSDTMAISRPRHRTTAFAMRSADHLFLAVNCQTTLSAEPAPSRRSGVRYDDLVPMDEDIVEVLLDPLNAGTRSPSDLFHIVVKRSGPCVTEIGILTDPPCGHRRPWPVHLEYATDDSAPGRWTIEMSIPVAALNADATQQTTWGFNISRHDAANQEVSTWSGASRNPYDPLSLGNLQLP